jgi:hypothetical protein
VSDIAVRVVVEDGLPYRTASWHLWRDHRVFVPCATIQNWVEAGGKKAEAQMESAFLEWAFADFSGYVAVDELDEGPLCVLSAVDNRRDKRMLYEVLDHNPTYADIRGFLGRVKTALEARDLRLEGITTDGSPLSPVPLSEVFGDVPHHICEFHGLAEVVKAVLRAVSSERTRLAEAKPKLPQGRPSTTQAKKAARKQKRLEQKSADLFTHRHLFVTHHLSNAERTTLMQITRGLPPLRKLRAIMEQVYTLFDRRCRTQTALDTLAKLRRRVQRFTQVGDTLKELFSPTLENALTCLDDTLLPSTSNAVERGNRRHRKMHKSVSRVRSLARLIARIALDMLHEAQAEGRQQTLVA